MARVSPGPAGLGGCRPLAGSCCCSEQFVPGNLTHLALELAPREAPRHPRLLTGPWGHLPGAPGDPGCQAHTPSVGSTGHSSRPWGRPAPSGLCSPGACRPGTCLSWQRWEQGCLGSPAQRAHDAPALGDKGASSTISWGQSVTQHPSHRGRRGQDSGAGPDWPPGSAPGSSLQLWAKEPPHGAPAA